MFLHNNSSFKRQILQRRIQWRTDTQIHSYLGQSNGQLSDSTGIQRGMSGTDQKELVVELVQWLEIENCRHRRHHRRPPYLGASCSLV